MCVLAYMCVCVLACPCLCSCLCVCLHPQESKPEVRSETDQDLPRGLLLVEFKSLVVSGPSRTRPEPLQSRNQNDKNFKKFRKVSHMTSSADLTTRSGVCVCVCVCVVVDH